VPALPGALGYIEAGLTPGGLERNYHFLFEPQAPPPADGHDHALPALPPAAGQQRAVAAPDLSPALITLLCDPQTSGGLLAAVPPAALAGLEADCARREVPLWRIGTVRAGRGIIVR